MSPEAEPVADDSATAEEAPETPAEEKQDAEHLQAFLDSCDDDERRELYDLLEKEFNPAKSDKKYTLSNIADFEK